jgi:hypothetical protein
LSQATDALARPQSLADRKEGRRGACALTEPHPRQCGRWVKE